MGNPDKYRELFEEIREGLAGQCIRELEEGYPLPPITAEAYKEPYTYLRLPVLKSMVDMLASAIVYKVINWEKRTGGPPKPSRF